MAHRLNRCIKTIENKDSGNTVEPLRDICHEGSGLVAGAKNAATAAREEQ